MKYARFYRNRYLIIREYVIFRSLPEGEWHKFSPIRQGIRGIKFEINTYAKPILPESNETVNFDLNLFSFTR